MSKNIRVQEGNLVVELDAATSVVAANPSTDGFDARIHMSLGGVISESTGGVGGFEADTWAAGDKAYLGVYNDETGQYAELVAHGSTFGAGSLNPRLYNTSSVAPFDFVGDYKTIMQLESSSAANTFVNVTDGTILKIWDDTEVDNVAIQHDGTNLVFTPTTTNAIALEGLYFDMLEIADPTFVADPGRGRIWVESSVPNRLMFTDDAGNDIVVAEFGTGPVNATGSPLDNQVAVFLDGDTIEGDANFTWTGTTLAIAGAGAQLLLPQELDAATPTLAFGDGDTGFYESADDALRIAVLGAERWQIDGSFLGSSTNGAGFLTQAAASGTAPAHTFKGDTDTGVGTAAADQLSLIAGAKEMLRLVETGTATTDQVIITPAVTSPAGAATPTLAFGDGDTGFYENADDELSIAVTGARQWYYSGVSFRGNAGDSPALENNSPTSTDPNIIPNRSDLNTGIGWAAADQLSLVTGGVESKRLTAATVQTTDATQTEIISIAVASGTGFGFRINIMGTEDATGDTVFLTAFGAIRNQGGTTGLVGNEVIDRTDDSGAAAWVITIAADDTTDALTVDVTGEAAHTIDWKCSVELLEV